MVEEAQDDNERVDQPMKRFGSEIGIPGTRARLTCKSKIQNRDVQGNAGEEIDCNMHVRRTGEEAEGTRS